MSINELITTNSNSYCKYGLSFLIPNENAINPCFYKLVFLLNSSFIYFISSFQLFKLVSCGKPLGRTSKYHKIPKSSLARIFIVLVQSVLFCFIKDGFMHSIPIFFIALPLTYLEVFYNSISSGSLIFYWLFQSILFFCVVTQNYLFDSQFKYLSSASPILVWLILLNSLYIFISSTFFYNPIHEVKKFYLDLGTIQANVLSNLTFSWMNELIAKGYKYEKITENDLPNPPEIVDSEKSFNDLNKIWESQLEKKSIIRALIKCFGLTVLSAVFFAICDDVLSFVQPQLLRLLIRFFNEDQPIIIGFLVALGLFLVSIIETALYNKFFILIYEAALGTKSSLMTLIYQKALNLSPESKKSYSTGEIVNMMSVDVNRIQDLNNQFQMLISAPIKLVLCIISLYSLLGNAIFAGILTMMIMIPINTFASRKLKNLHKTQMKFKDLRTKTISEILSSIKSIKLYSIESSMFEKLNHIRNDMELGNLRTIGISVAFMNFSWSCVPFFVSCSSFTTFAIYSSIPLSPEIVFPALALFDLLSEPIYAIPSIITALIETSVALDRISKFLNSDELTNDLITHYSKVDKSGEVTIKVENCKFLWSKGSAKEEPTTGTAADDEESNIENDSNNNNIALKVEEFYARKNELACIVGKVGAGKSTFLKAMLGQLPCTNLNELSPKKLEIHGSVAYCAQIPWISNASVKENILFGHKLDQEFYEKTIDACQLLPDIEILPDGDETQVGEKGISLSGGQKARLSLARAVYARSDVYLLDDILSAVDAHVGKNIIEKVINGLLATKTVVLATNSISVLSHADNLILLENGEIVETGSFKEVMGKNGKLFELINEFSLNSKEETAELEQEQDGEEGKKRKASFDTIRRASISTLKPKTLVSLESDKKTAQTEEKAKVGKVNFKVYKTYAKACGYFSVCALLILMMCSTIFNISSNYWLKNWSENNDKVGSNKNVLKYVGIYAFFGIGYSFFQLVRTVVMWCFCSIKASKLLHNKMAKAIIRSPMSFFETTPTGRIMNRFSNDIYSLDESLPRVFVFFFSFTISTIFTLAFIGITMPSFLIITACLSVVYIFYQRYYIATSRDLKRIVSISKSPIFAHLQETLSGVETIRAYDQKERFQYFHIQNLSFNLKSLYIFRSINRWLSVRLQFIGSVIIFTTAGLTISHNLGGGMAGLLMTYALRVTSSLSWIVRMTVEVETNIVAVERILDYCELKPEAEEITEVVPPEGWPAEGAVKFDHYSTRYRENLDLVLNDISLDIKPKEKIGIVGRTGAGKSTLVLAIFRMIEPTSGLIYIDGLNTMQLGLHDLRKNLAIIPQDSQAFEGTIRSNLDPVGRYSDEELWRALELSHLKEHVRSMKNEEEVNIGLDTKLNEGGSNLSVGQRQLLCLSRALLNPSNVLILDEATSSVDVETDRIVQKTIREEFKNRTILTIAHRIDTVMDNDRIVVLEQGKVKEFDSPENLLKDRDSLFYNLCLQGGYITEEVE